MKKFISALAISAYLALCNTPAIAFVYEPHQLQEIKKPCAPLQAGMFGGLLGFNAFTQTVAIIVSVQSFSITVTTTSNTQTITAVTPATASIFYNGQTTNDSYAAGASMDLSAGMVVLTNGTTLTATKNTTGTYTCTVNGFIVDWNPGIVFSVQRGTVTMTTSTSQTQAITSITVNQSAVMYCGFNTTYGGAVMSYTWPQITITAANQVTAARGAALNNVTVSYEVTTFQVGILNSPTQQVSGTMTGTSSGQTGITGVDSTYTLTWYGGQSGSFANNDASKRSTCCIDSSVPSGFFNFARTSSTDNVTINGTVVELRYWHFKNAVYRSGISIASGNTTFDDNPPKGIDANTFFMYLGNTNSAVTTVSNSTLPALSINGNQARLSRNTSAANTCQSQYEVAYPN